MSNNLINKEDNDNKIIKKQELSTDEKLKLYMQTPMSEAEAEQSKWIDKFLQKEVPSDLKHMYDMLDENPDIRDHMKKDAPEYLMRDLDRQIKARRQLRKDIKDKGYIYGLWKNNKLGIDRFVFYIPITILICLPLYYYITMNYNKQTYNKKMYYNGDFANLEHSNTDDIDNYSTHTTYYREHVVKENVRKKMKIYNEIDKLQKELNM